MISDSSTSNHRKRVLPWRGGTGRGYSVGYVYRSQHFPGFCRCGDGSACLLPDYAALAALDDTALCSRLRSVESSDTNDQSRRTRMRGPSNPIVLNQDFQFVVAHKCPLTHDESEVSSPPGPRLLPCSCHGLSLTGEPVYLFSRPPLHCTTFSVILLQYNASGFRPSPPTVLSPLI